MTKKNICPEGYKPITSAQVAITTAAMRNFQDEMKKTEPIGFPWKVSGILTDEGLSPEQVDEEIEELVPTLSEDSICIKK